MIENPTKKIRLPKIPKSLPKHLTRDEALELLDWTRNFPYRYKFEKTRAVAIISTFMFAGLRVGELISLRNEHVRFEDRTIFVKSGKGNKDRLIPMSSDLFLALNDYRKDRKRLDRCNPHFFVRVNRDQSIGPKAVQSLVERLRSKSGIFFFPHMLRHTFATLMLEGGADIYAISKMMGHADIKTTTIYLAATTAHLKSEIEKHALSFNSKVLRQDSYLDHASFRPLVAD